MTAATTTRPRVGFIGLGNMGYAMSGNLVAAGFAVTGFDGSRETTARAAEAHGLAVADDPAALIGGSDVVILMLPNGKIVRQVLEMAAAALHAGLIVIDMSSSAPVGTRDLGTWLADKGVLMLDAPVSGGVGRAKTGTLAIMVGGDAALLDRCRPVLDALGKSIIHVGPLGAGHAMKALNNYVSATGLVAACEAVKVAQRFGIDGAKAVESLNASTGRNNSTENKLAQFVLSESYGSGFSLGLMRKDLATAIELAGLMQVETAIADTVLHLWEKAEADLGGSADHTEIARMIRSTDGV